MLVSDTKDLREIRPVSLRTVAPNAGGLGKNRRLFDKWLATLISRKLHQTDTYFLLKLNRKSYVLYIADDLEWPLTAPYHPNFYILHRF